MKADLAYCTLFNKAYFSRGLAMIQSLRATGCLDPIHVLCMDQETLATLGNLSLENLFLVALEDFESAELRAVRPTRTFAEYCWTCTPALIAWVMERTEVGRCLYLDADLYFYHNPQIVNQDWTGSVLLTDHWYTPRYDQSEKSGRFCVQYMGFKNDAPGRMALNWWKDACLEWCYDRHEPGRFGDQKYLDDWPTRFPGVEVSGQRGAGVAPWNLQQYRLEDRGGRWFIRSRKEPQQSWPLVFFHFHGITIYTDGSCEVQNYALGKDFLEKIFLPYLKVLRGTGQEISDRNATFDPHGRKPLRRNLKTPFSRIKNFLSGTYNRYHGIFS